MKKWFFTAIAGVVLTPIIAFSWGNIKSIWAAPQRLESVEKGLYKNSESTDQIAKLLLEQKTRIDTQEQLNELREKNLKEQLSLIAELKKKK